MMPRPDYMEDASKLLNLLEFLTSHCRRVWPDGTQHLSFWSILDVSGQSLASNCPIVNSRDPNLKFGHVNATLVPPKAQHNHTGRKSLFGHRFRCFTALGPRFFSNNVVVCDPFLICTHHPIKKWLGSIWLRFRRKKSF